MHSTVKEGKESTSGELDGQNSGAGELEVRPEPTYVSGFLGSTHSSVPGPSIHIIHR